MNEIAVALLKLQIPTLGIVEAAKSCAFACPSLSIDEIVNLAMGLA
ncbi:MAG: hypothetical protein ABL933_15780 [Methyloglobulus sp.]